MEEAALFLPPWFCCMCLSLWNKPVVRDDQTDFLPLFILVQMVKRLPAMWETWPQFLGREDPLEKEMAIHSSTLAWKIPWTEEPDRLQSIGLQRVGHD